MTKDEFSKIRMAGYQMSNVCFNWAQSKGRTLTAEDCTMLRKLSSEWDDAIFQAIAPRRRRTSGALASSRIAGQEKKE